jgi:hypothetical protein
MTGPIGVTTVRGLVFVTTLCVTVEIGEYGVGKLTDNGDNGDTGLTVNDVNGEKTVVDALNGELNIVVIGV